MEQGPGGITTLYCCDEIILDDVTTSLLFQTNAFRPNFHQGYDGSRFDPLSSEGLDGINDELCLSFYSNRSYQQLSNNLPTTVKLIDKLS